MTLVRTAWLHATHAVALTATAFIQDTEIMSRAALLGKDNDAKQFQNLQKESQQFQRKIYNVTNRFYATDSQCANSIRLSWYL